MNQKITFIISIFLIILIMLIAKKTVINYANHEIVLGDSNLLGDVNGDEKINSFDYILIRKHILGTSVLNDSQRKRADVNSDGKINSSDYIIIKKSILFGTKIAESKIEVTFDANGGSVTPTSMQVVKDKSYGTLPTPTRYGYKFVGWYTSKDGGNKVTADTIATGNVTIYAIWENNYIITQDSRYSGYSNIASYDSATLKYRVIIYQGQDIVLIWAKDPQAQLNSALASSDGLHSKNAEIILNNEISTYGYQNKGMVAVNASFYEPTDHPNGTPWGGVVISHGRIAKNTKVSAGVIGINSTGDLKLYYHETAATLQSAGLRNTFVVSNTTAADPTTDHANRTQICQIDKNNFAILSGDGVVKECGKQLMNLTGCQVAFNLDAGGSRKLYYKNSSTSKMTKRFGGDRIIPDMLYFVEQ